MTPGISLGFFILFRRFAPELAGSRHAAMERDWIEVESVGPGECTKFHEDACEERRIFERAHHLSVSRCFLRIIAVHGYERL